MKYERPEVVTLARAADAVRGSGAKPDDVVFDNGDDRLTIGAYEADE